MAFFDPPQVPPPPVEPEPRPQMPIWWDEPDTVLGGVVTTQFVLARTDTFAVAVRRIVAYPTGFAMGMVIVARDGAILPDNGPGPGVRRGRADPLDTAFRFGLLLADGTKMVADWRSRYFGGDLSLPPDLEALSAMEKPPRPILSPSGGSSSSGLQWSGGYWATPLPPPGPLGFVVEWLEGGLPETSVTIEADVILDAAATARSIWDQ